MPRTTPRGPAAATALAALLSLAACTTETSDAQSAADGRTITIGTTDQVSSLDPAGAWDAGSGTIETEVYATLLSAHNGSTDAKPDLAASITLSAPTKYTVRLKPGLKFANGHDLTSSDVKFSFDRQLKIADKNGPSSLLYNLESVAAPAPDTVEFTLKSPNDTLFPQILTTAAGLVADEEVFPADKILDDEAIIAAKPWAGPYVVDSYTKNSVVSFSVNPAYSGGLGAPKNTGVVLKYYTAATNLKLDIQRGDIDVVYRTLTIPDLQDLGTKPEVVVHTGAGNGIRFIVFDLKTQPFGSATAQADPAKALAVRQAAASLIDRTQLAEQVYKSTFQPLYSYVPQGITGATESLKPLYGDQHGGPDKAAAARLLSTAGVATPVALNLQYNTDHYGSSSEDEYALIKTQLEASGLFKVTLQSTEWSQYGKQRVADQYPAYQLGWYADYLDADNYLGSFFADGNWVNNGYDDAAVKALIKQEQTETDPGRRTAALQQIQDAVAKAVPIVPLLQGSTAIVTRAKIDGVPQRLDSAYQFRWAELAKR
ncbi:ABC transporter substrate-binding protein [Dactylosporangium sp. NPDC051484]|uniref:ABC transporter substrate-binding protein n=1 Tax=Dactylosporangium sp. NPDC051484 TaxID=3154942 RepID=UPI0034505742